MEKFSRRKFLEKSGKGLVATGVAGSLLDLDLLQFVRRMENPLPVVVQTALLGPTLEDLLRHAGAFRVLMKGGPVGDLVRSIKEACPASHGSPT